MTKKKRSRLKKSGYAKLEVETRKGRLVLPEWIHVREDMWKEVCDLLECVKAHCSGSEEWLAVEAGKLLKEFGHAKM